MLQRKCYVVNIHPPLLQICSRRTTAVTSTASPPTTCSSGIKNQVTQEARKGMCSCRGGMTKGEEERHQTAVTKDKSVLQRCKDTTLVPVLVRLNKYRKDLHIAHNSSFPVTTQVSFMDSGPSRQQRKCML